MPDPSGLEPDVPHPDDVRTGDQLEPALGGFFEAMLAARQPRAKVERLRALIRLGREGDRRALPALTMAAGDRDWVIRKYAVAGLGLIGSPEAAPLVAPALADARPEVRRAAARALKRLDVGTWRETWLKAFDDPDWLVRAAALEALGRYLDAGTEPLVLAALKDPIWLNRYQALKHLEARPTPTGLAAMLGALASDKELAPWLAPAIARFGPDALPALLTLLDNAPPWRALAIATALGMLDDDRAREALAGLVGHPDAEIEAAIHTHGPAMRTRLAAALADPEWMVRWHAAKLLGTLGDPAASISLLPLLADSRPDVRLATLEALKRLADPRTEADLRRCLQDPSWHLRLGAVEALAALDTEGATEALVDALADKRSEVVHAARRALQAKGERAEDALTEGLLRHPECYDEIAWLLKALKGARA